MGSNICDGVESLAHMKAGDVVVGVGGETGGDAKVRCDQDDVNKFASGGLWCEGYEGLEEWVSRLTMDEEKLEGTEVVMVDDGVCEPNQVKPDSAVEGQVEPDLSNLVHVVTACCTCTDFCFCATSHTSASTPSSSSVATSSDQGHAKDGACAMDDVESDAETDTMVLLDTPVTTGGPIHEWAEMTRRFAASASSEYVPLTPRRPTKAEILDFFAHHHCRCAAANYEELDGTCGYCTSGLRRRVRDELWRMAYAKKEETKWISARKTLFDDSVGEDDEGWPKPMA